MEGLRCPECKQEDRLHIMGTSMFTLVDDGTEEHSDVEYDKDAFTRCPGCGHEGQLKDFNIEDQKPKALKRFRVIAQILKRYETVVEAYSEVGAWNKASETTHLDGNDIESDWEEDVNFYEVEVLDDVEELEDVEEKPA